MIRRPRNLSGSMTSSSVAMASSLLGVGQAGGGGGAPDYDADTDAFIARMSTPPSTVQAEIYDYFVVQAKAIGAWSSITDCGFLCAHDAQAAKLGVKNAINLTNVGAGPTHHPNYGMQGNGSSTALTTTYKIPSGNQNSTSLGIVVLSNVAEDAASMGNANSIIVPRFASNPNEDKLFARANGSASGTINSQFDPIGFFVVNRVGSTAAQEAIWKRGVKILSSTATSATPDATYDIWIGGRNQASPQYSTRIHAFWFIGTGMTDTVVENFSALVEEVCALLTASSTVISDVTDRTRALYRYMTKMSRQPSYLLGAFDNQYWSLGSTPDLIADIVTMTGSNPAILTMEWADPDRAGGVTDTNAQRARIIAHHAAGGIISLHQHPGNPVTGTFAQTPSVESPPTTGNQYDKSGSPVLNCLAGGSRRTEFLAYVDRLITFLNSCVDAGGQPIPIMLRWWHEVDGAWFWWTDTGTPANTIQLWKDFVDRIRNAGVKHVLFDFNRSLITTPGSTYYPGSDYVDILSGDYYDDDATTANVAGLSEAVTAFAALRATGATKPMWMAEIGYRNAGPVVSDIWTTKTGYYHRDRYSLSAGFGHWRSPFGPADGALTKPTSSAWLQRPTASRASACPQRSTHGQHDPPLRNSLPILHPRISRLRHVRRTPKGQLMDPEDFLWLAAATEQQKPPEPIKPKRAPRKRKEPDGNRASTAGHDTVSAPKRGRRRAARPAGEAAALREGD
jgi:mannan endo-1,4-beta-mannosidase